MSRDFYNFFCKHTNQSCSDKWLHSELIKAEVFSHRGLWRMHVGVYSPINNKEINIVKNKLLKKFNFLNDIEIIPIPCEPDLVNDIINLHRDELSSSFFSNQEIKNHIIWQVDGLRIDLQTKDEKAFTYLIENKTCNKLANWLWEEYLLRVIVRAIHTDNVKVEKNVERFIPKKEIELIEGMPTPELTPNNRRNTKRVKQNSLSSTVKSMEISDVEEGMRKAVVEGEIWHKENTQLRDGRYVISYYLTDYQDSIIVKNFIDDYADDLLQIGDWVKVEGSVRYDNYVGEVIIFLNSYLIGKKPERQDKSPQKRVELHLHTKMSAMDGLTEIDAVIKRAAKWGHPAIAITDHGCIQSFPLAYQAARKYNIKVIYGVEAYLVNKNKKESPYHIILLAQNKEGLQNLYKLVSISYLDYFYRHPKIPRDVLEEYRAGIIVGSACEAGELYKAFVNNLDPDEIKKIATFYDYLEIQPLQNNDFLVRDGLVKDKDALREINRQILALGDELNIPVVATSDAHFLDPEHEIYRRIIMAGQGYKDVENELPLYFKTTEEMLNDFSYLGENNAQKVVIDNSLLIAQEIGEIKPIPDGFYPPQIEGAAADVNQLTWDRAYELYGAKPPKMVAERIEKELNSITSHGFSVLYLIAHKLVKKSNEDGYLVGSRGSVGSSLVAYLTGVTEVNPLPPHYRCPGCKETEFILSTSIGSGADLPNKTCAHCNVDLIKEGFDIPFETFLGFTGDKVPDIDLNFSGEYQSKAHQYVEELFGSANVYRAGTVSTIAEKTAFGFVKKYMDEHARNIKKSEINRLVKGITGVRRTTGQHPGGLIVVPQDKNIYEFTPLQYPADKKASGVITTHFEYHALEDQLVKLDILGHDDPTVIKELEDLTGIDATTISLSEAKTMDLFSSVEPLGLEPKNINSTVGTFGIPEFGTKFVRQMLETTRPKTFAELVRISGLSHGTDVWLNNAQYLIKNQIAELSQVICTRDDIMTFLIYKGIDKKIAFKIMEQVRRGRGLTKEDEEIMQDHQVPTWYIESCKKIKYMFPKAHAVAYVTMAYRIAYFKVYHPLAFYASFFSIRAEDFDAETILAGYERVKNKIQIIENAGYAASPKDKKLLPILEVALEMYARGFNFYPVDITYSSASKFIIKDNGLLLPFSALPNVGVTAARGIENAIKEGEFVSVEDFQAKTNLNKTAMDVLRRYDCFKNLPESTQISLFG
ncbi:MAG TPA: PolC-type DNA polymerase III [Syntrophomonadaceae bacterium]|nr:PolC-type DNA polymerase III [Syntrophomonadaceae bacterium]